MLAAPAEKSGPKGVAAAVNVAGAEATVEPATSAARTMVVVGIAAVGVWTSGTAAAVEAAAVPAAVTVAVAAVMPTGTGIQLVGDGVRVVAALLTVAATAAG